MKGQKQLGVEKILVHRLGVFPNRVPDGSRLNARRKQGANGKAPTVEARENQPKVLRQRTSEHVLQGGQLRSGSWRIHVDLRVFPVRVNPSDEVFYAAVHPRCVPHACPRTLGNPSAKPTRCTSENAALVI